MSREKIMDPAFQKAFTEAINKENKVRVKWHLEHGVRLKRSAPEEFRFDDEPDDDDEDFVPPLEPDEHEEEPPITHRKGQESPKEEEKVAGKMTKIEELKLMRPVPIDTKKILYKGVSKEDEGRKKYLKERSHEGPEDKYFSPICSSWDYGWTYGQEHELKSPEYGNVQILKTSFFRPNDPQLKPRDPIE